MPSQTYTADVLVLRKTKLGESDLILTCLASDGQQIRFVAKGARKPGNTFSSRLELFSAAHVLLVRGKSLDVVKEVRLIDGFGQVRTDLTKSTAASPMVEILARVSQDGLESPKLYDMTLAALTALASCPEGTEGAITAAHLLKTFAFSGLAPSLNACVSCGSPVFMSALGVRFSYDEGGVVCAACKAHVASVELPAAMISWVDTLLHARFAQIPQMEIADEAVFDALRFCQQWARIHVGSAVKSLDFMLTMAAHL